MRAITVTLAIAVLGIGNEGVACAQEGVRASIIGAAIYSTQSAGTIPGAGNPGTATPALEGSAPGFAVGAHFAITHAFGVGIEVSDTARFETVQTTAGASPSHIDNLHRDLIVSGMVFGRREFAHSRLEISGLGGASYVQEDTVLKVSTAPPFSSGPFGPYGPERSLTRSTIGGVTGVDLWIVPTRHVAVGPTFRAHLVSRAGTSEPQSALLGLNTVVLRFGGAVRVTF